MNDNNNKAPPLPPRLNLSRNCQKGKIQSFKKFNELDVIPLPPKQINKSDLFNHVSNNLSNQNLESQILPLHKSMDFNNKSAFNNNFYLSNLNYLTTIPLNNYNSLSNSPLSVFPHSNSFSNFSLKSSLNEKVLNKELELNSIILNKIKNLNKKVPLRKQMNENLIDLGSLEENDFDCSNILTIFDPLSINKKFNNEEINNLNIKNENSNEIYQKKVTEKNFYESINYETIDKKDSFNLVHDNKFFDNSFLKLKNTVANEELILFKNELIKHRLNYKFSDKSTNFGYVVSSRLNFFNYTSTSVKLVIETDLTNHSICFTCNVNTSVEHVICHAVCTISNDTTIDFSNYILKIYGINEYLVNDSSLGDYRYIHNCHKFDKIVKLSLIDKVKYSIEHFSRSKKDDEEVKNLKEYDILPNLLLCRYSELTYENVKILLDVIDSKYIKLLNTEASQKETCYALFEGVRQAVKNLVVYLGLETKQLSDALNNLKQLYFICDQYKKSSNDSKLSQTIDLVHPEVISNAILFVKKAIFSLLNLFSKVFPVDFYCNFKNKDIKNKNFIDVSQVTDNLIVKLDNLSSLNIDWECNYEEFYFKCELIHGEKILNSLNTSFFKIKNNGLTSIIDIETYINFEDIPICNLPRETYLYFTLIGVSKTKNSNDQNLSDNEVYNELGITATKLFDEQGFMMEGTYVLGLWPEKYINSIYKPIIKESCLERKCALLIISLIENENLIKFSEINDFIVNNECKTSTNLFDSEDHENIYYILNQDPMEEMNYEDKKVLWERRESLINVPNALPKILNSAPSWKIESLFSIYKLINKWKNLTLNDALQLLLPAYPDKFVREMAVKSIYNLDDDEIYDYLPQLVHALRYETNLNSPLTWLLFKKSYSNIRFAHQLYWLFKTSINESINNWRIQVLFNSLIITSSSNLKKLWLNEDKMLSILDYTSLKLKSEKDNFKMKTLVENLENLNSYLMDNKTSLPLNLSMEVVGINFKLCTYFNSNTLPIKIAYKVKGSVNTSSKTTFIEALYKVGDDLRQDTITMQMINIMDKLWLKEGLDLKIVTFNCLATDEKKGFIEIVKNSETLRRIQGEQGVTGSFKDNSIANWLKKYNRSEYEYKKAVENFTHSCAGYAVATYVLGVGDRHNDNIMLTTSGHLFHIDFGKFLGDVQMIGTIKRDRVPFVLTNDMAYVINCGDKPSMQFQNFIDLCCQAYNIIRHNSNLFLSLFSLMLSGGISGLTKEAIKYVHNAMKSTLTNCKASEEFNKLISDALRSRSTQINFFIHNLSQMRFSSDYNDQKFLSFTSKIYTVETDGDIKSIKIEDVRKVGEQTKQYYFVFVLKRSNQTECQYLLRTYKEIYELYQKLSTSFRLEKFYPLTKPKSNFKKPIQKQIDQVKFFFDDLMRKTNEILFSDLIYTFFHPLTRDQDSKWNTFNNEQIFKGTLLVHNKLNRNTQGCNGEIQLSFLYKNCSLMIMVKHAKNLCSSKKVNPDTYVKTYLLPDPFKHSKQKTKIIYKNNHPTYMEMIVYQISIQELNKRILEVSVWDYTIKENVLLGATEIQLCDIDLNKEICSWYALTFENKRREKKS